MANTYNRQADWKFFIDEICPQGNGLVIYSNVVISENTSSSLTINSSGVHFSDGTSLTSGNIISTTNVNNANIISDLTLIKSVLEHHFNDVTLSGNGQYVTVNELNINGNIRGNNFIGDLYGNIYKNDLFIDTSSVNIKDIMTVDTNKFAIGRQAGNLSQPENTIILNAKGTQLNAHAGNGFYVAPIAYGITSSVLYYDTNFEQITYAEKIIMSVKTSNDTKQTVKAGETVVITNWKNAHVNIGPDGWNQSTYVFPRSGIYRMSFKVIVSNYGNAESSLRYLNGGLYITNSTYQTVVEDLDTTILYNASVNSGYVERGSLDITTIRSVSKNDTLEIKISLLDAANDTLKTLYTVESGLLCIEQIN